MTLFGRSKKDEAEAEATAQNNSYLKPDSSTRGWNSDSDVPPAYEDDAPSYDHVMAGRTAASSSGSPSYAGQFMPDTQLQIQAIGYDYNAAMYGNTLEQITVCQPDTGHVEYTSVRLKKNSNSCGLVRGSDDSSVPLIATIYRWGPGRSPRMKILQKDSHANVQQAIESDKVPCELIELRSRNMFSRTQIFETSFGTFEWRYGSRDERRATDDANSLLIMEKIETVSGGLKSSKKARRVAQLVRNDEFRTPGTNKNMGGNGGRLMMDVSSGVDGHSVTTKDFEAFVVAGCICMLKREADRFKDNVVAAVT